MKTRRVLCALLVVVSLCFANIAGAAPSGGPYGPVQQRYDLPAAKTVIYVAPNARPDATGQAVDQPTTLARAVASVTTGAAIVLRGGTYRIGDLRLNQGVTIQPFGDERPVLKGTEIAREWEPAGPQRWRTRWSRLFPARPADWWRPERHTHETPLHLFNNDMVFIDGELLAAVGREADVSAKSYFIDYEQGTVTIGANPAGHVVEITAYDNALIRTFKPVHGKQNDGTGPVIRGLTFTQYAYRALEVEGVEPQKHADPATFGKEVVGTVLENLTISHCSRVAGYFRGDKLVIRNCLVSDCGTEGIYVINSGDILLERNIVTRTNSAERLSGYYASAVKIFNQSYRALVRDNLIIDNPHASGVWFDVGEVDAVFVDNWVERTNDGFFFEISKGAICAGNVFVNCTPGTRVLNSSDVQQYQNTFYNSAAAFARNERSAAGDHFGWHASAGPDVTERHGHVFQNNLMVADADYREPLVQFWQGQKVRDQLKDPQIRTMDGNVYVRRAGPKRVPIVTWSPVQNEAGAVDIFQLDELRRLHGQIETRSHALADYWGPLFRSAELGHFELQPGFPFAAAGLPLPTHIRSLLKPSPETVFVGALAPAPEVVAAARQAFAAANEPQTAETAGTSARPDADATVVAVTAQLLAQGRIANPPTGSLQSLADAVATQQAALRSSPQLQAEVVRQSYADAFGRAPTSQELAAVAAGTTYIELMRRHVQHLAGTPAAYEEVIRRAYPVVISRDVYPEEITYWQKHGVVPYALLLACLDDWARRNQPGLMVTAGTPTVSPNSIYLRTQRLTPALAAEARRIAGLPAETPAGEQPYRVIAAGGEKLVSGGGIHFVAAGRSEP